MTVSFLRFNSPPEEKSLGIFEANNGGLTKKPDDISYADLKKYLIQSNIHIINTEVRKEKEGSYLINTTLRYETDDEESDKFIIGNGSGVYVPKNDTLCQIYHQ